jgi:hypothetical protein
VEDVTRICGMVRRELIEQCCDRRYYDNYNYFLFEHIDNDYILHINYYQHVNDNNYLIDHNDIFYDNNAGNMCVSRELSAMR